MSENRSHPDHQDWEPESTVENLLHSWTFRQTKEIIFYQRYWSDALHVITVLIVHTLQTSCLLNEKQWKQQYQPFSASKSNISFREHQGKVHQASQVDVSSALASSDFSKEKLTRSNRLASSRSSSFLTISKKSKCLRGNRKTKKLPMFMSWFRLKLSLSLEKQQYLSSARTCGNWQAFLTWNAVTDVQGKGDSDRPKEKAGRGVHTL